MPEIYSLLCQVVAKKFFYFFSPKHICFRDFPNKYTHFRDLLSGNCHKIPSAMLNHCRITTILGEECNGIYAVAFFLHENVRLRTFSCFPPDFKIFLTIYHYFINIPLHHFRCQTHIFLHDKLFRFCLMNLFLQLLNHFLLFLHLCMK